MANNDTNSIDQNGPQFIQSREPANNGFGQPGYRGPSSLLPGQATNQSPYAPKDDDAKAILKAGGMSFTQQTRKISDKGYPTHPGMTARKSDGAIPDNGGPVTRKI